MKAINEVLLDAEEVLKLGHEKVEAFLAGDRKEKFGVTQLSKDIAKEKLCTFSFVYSLLSAYMTHRDDLEVKRGPHGGIVPKKNHGSESPKNTA